MADHLAASRFSWRVMVVIDGGSCVENVRRDDRDGRAGRADRGGPPMGLVDVAPGRYVCAASGRCARNASWRPVLDRLLDDGTARPKPGCLLASRVALQFVEIDLNQGEGVGVLLRSSWKILSSAERPAAVSTAMMSVCLASSHEAREDSSGSPRCSTASKSPALMRRYSSTRRL